MKEQINITPVICKSVKENNKKIEILENIELSDENIARFCIAIFSNIFTNENISIQLFLRNLAKDMGLDIGKIEIVKAENDEVKWNTNHCYLNIETTFPDEGEYALDIYLVEEGKTAGFFEKDNEHGNFTDILASIAFEVIKK